MGWRNGERRVQGKVDKGGGLWSGDVCVQGQGDQGSEEEFDTEAADFDVSAAEGIEEGGGVGRGERSVLEVCDRRGGGVDGEGRYGW